MKWLIAKLILYPLVYRNYNLRQAGIVPDCWYWADVKLMMWGFLERDESKFPRTLPSNIALSQHTFRKRTPIYFKGVQLEYKPNLSETDDEIYIADEPK